jgi:hypothetical protein
MFNLAKFVAKVVWIVCLLALGTLIGVAHGWARHGWQGAIVLGCVDLASARSLPLHRWRFFSSSVRASESGRVRI